MFIALILCLHNIHFYESCMDQKKRKSAKEQIFDLKNTWKYKYSFNICWKLYFSQFIKLLAMSYSLRKARFCFENLPTFTECIFFFFNITSNSLYYKILERKSKVKIKFLRCWVDLGIQTKKEKIHFFKKKSNIISFIE